MHIRSLLLTAALLGLVLSGCKGDDTPAASPADAAAPPTAPPTAPPASADATPTSVADTTAPPAAEQAEPGSPTVVSVKLLEPGAEPRQALRFAPEVGDATLDLEVQLDEKMRLGGRDLPSPSPPRLRMTVATKVGAVDDGVARYDVSVTQAAAVGLDSAPLPAQRLMPLIIGTIRGVEVGATVDALGRVEQAAFPLPSDSNAQVKNLAESYLQALQNLPVPLPEEPVGVGARWEVVQQVVSGRLRVEQTLTYELVSVEGTVVKTKVTATQAMHPDGATGPGLPAGAKVQSFEGTGTGEKTFDLTRVLPTSAVLQMHGVAELELAKRGGIEPGTLQVVMDVLLKAGPGIDAPDLEKPEPPPPPKDEEGEHDHDHGHGH